MKFVLRLIWNTAQLIYATVIYMSFKGNPSFQGILNWIIQILHIFCRKQHKSIENSRIIEQNVAVSLCSSLSLLQLVLRSPSSKTGYFQFLDTVLNVTSDHLSVRAVIVSFSAVKISFAKLSPAKYHCLHKKPYMFHVFSHHRTSLQISLL